MTKVTKAYLRLVEEIEKGDKANNDVIINKILFIKRCDKKLCIQLLINYRNCEVIKRNMEQIIMDISYTGKLKYYKIKEMLADDGSNNHLLLYATDFERLSRREGCDFKLCTIVRLILNRGCDSIYSKKLFNLVMNLDNRRISNQLLAFGLNADCILDNSIYNLSSLTETQLLVLKKHNKIDNQVLNYYL